MYLNNYATASAVASPYTALDWARVRDALSQALSGSTICDSTGDGVLFYYKGVLEAGIELYFSKDYRPIKAPRTIPAHLQDFREKVSLLQDYCQSSGRCIIVNRLAAIQLFAAFPVPQSYSGFPASEKYHTLMTESLRETAPANCPSFFNDYKLIFFDASNDTITLTERPSPYLGHYGGIPVLFAESENFDNDVQRPRCFLYAFGLLTLQGLEPQH